jgi:hypothetical protein
MCLKIFFKENTLRKKTELFVTELIIIPYQLCGNLQSVIQNVNYYFEKATIL